VQAPLGLLLPGTAVAFALLALLYGAALRTAMLLEAWRHVQALESERRGDRRARRPARPAAALRAQSMRIRR
jgi:hypothetical protein